MSALLQTPKFLMGLTIALLLAGCAYPPAASEDAPDEVAHSAAHLINPGATVKVAVYGEDAMSGEFVVDHNGDLTLPMIGEIPATGLTKYELRTAIKKALKAEGYMTNPVVSLNILTPRPVYILGEVKNPGEYLYKPNLDVFEAIALAGGYTPRASHDDVLIGRGRSPQKVEYNGHEDTPVLPGDSITVRERIF